ncbi:MAG: hypothetical protein JXA57_05865 [Armatimonadetes bacterium]|nr:hypothetical protein [Armatimonadota bacterium]
MSEVIQRRSGRSLPLVLGVFLVVVLAAVGVLVWRLVALSAEVDELSYALTSTTTTAAPPTTTTTQEDPWRGGRMKYLFGQKAVLGQRAALAASTSMIGAGHKPLGKVDIPADIATLAASVNGLPPSPENVRRAQDGYFDALMKLHSAACVLSATDSSANLDSFNRARSEEHRLFLIWMRELDRTP